MLVDLENEVSRGVDFLGFAWFGFLGFPPVERHEMREAQHNLTFEGTPQ